MNHRHLWFTEQQSGHKWCHLCHIHAPDSKGPCVENGPSTRLWSAYRPQMTNAIAGPQTSRGVR